MKNILKTSLLFSLLLMPILVGAQYLTKTGGILAQGAYLIEKILVPLAFTLALLYFFYGIAKYIWSEGQGKEDGRKIMIWGVIALFVMSSIWGIIYFIRVELQIGGDPQMPIPSIVPSIGR